ncbi:AMP-binding protein [Nitrospirillum amazonense]|nr:AMP-binding protein [Nitrospirillum amazonense]MDG3442757.1 AMP-binding protein [Nitrospirillum amazonense]
MSARIPPTSSTPPAPPAPTFDLWVSDVVMAWGVGAALSPLTRAEMDDIAAIPGLIARRGITVATMAPSYLRLFERAPLPPLRILMTVGEAPIAADARHYAARLACYNGYGPTENTAATTVGRVDPTPPSTCGSPTWSWPGAPAPPCRP